MRERRRPSWSSARAAARACRRRSLSRRTRGAQREKRVGGRREEARRSRRHGAGARGSEVRRETNRAQASKANGGVEQGRAAGEESGWGGGRKRGAESSGTHTHTHTQAGKKQRGGPGRHRHGRNISQRWAKVGMTGKRGGRAEAQTGGERRILCRREGDGSEREKRATRGGRNLLACEQGCSTMCMHADPCIRGIVSNPLSILES